jgi:membrane metallo-endopeptidase-like protein 1
MLGLPHEYLIKGMDDKIVQAYFKFMIDFVEIFGIDRKQAKEDLKESLQFEIELAKVIKLL